MAQDRVFTKEEERTISEISEALQGERLVYETTRFIMISELGYDSFRDLQKEAFTRIMMQPDAMDGI